MKKHLNIFKEIILIIILAIMLFSVLLINSFVCYFFTSLFVASAIADWIFIIFTVILSTIELLFLYFINHLLFENSKEVNKNETGKD